MTLLLVLCCRSYESTAEARGRYRKLLFNARAESITDVNFWKKSFSLRHCIVPADSFLEWQKTQQGKNRNLSSPSEIETIWHGRPMGALEEPEDQSMGRHFRDRDCGCE
jgi:hypothetical protein